MLPKQLAELSAGNFVKITFNDGRQPVIGKYLSSNENFVSIMVDNKVRKYKVEIIDAIEEI